MFKKIYCHFRYNDHIETCIFQQNKKIYISKKNGNKMTFTQLKTTVIVCV